ncbi:hypothetical protein [Pontibacillus litoralis]|uniref:Uncharacterized protein n=1 Tax=Pontibacillus litoralis JSM 072002 TaxID=1385512 RepID=A0A0A5HNI3_9BACI|nr:hypothetical protein [Pontibacillus litoralis]KGX85202.1 hypothetical protein N784_09910 [Pontibacillus litoralis JSM 072002]
MKKLREKFLMNISSKSEVKKEKFTRWIDAQSNAQNSIFSLIEHSIDRYGYEDITDHEIAKKLHTEMLYYNNNLIKQNEEKIQTTKLNETQSKTENKSIGSEHKRDEPITNDIKADLSSF